MSTIQITESPRVRAREAAAQDVAPEAAAARALREGAAGPISTAELQRVFRPVFDRIAERTVAREQEHELPFECFAWLNELRFGALTLPLERGGYGASLEQAVELLIELAAADSSVAHVYRSHLGFLASLGADEADVWFPRVAAGQTVGNAATERSGVALGTATTTLTRSDGDGSWLLEGTKYYSTGSIFSDWIQVTAQIPGQEARSHALVGSDWDGVEMIDDWDGFGQQLTGTGTTHLRGVRVPAENVRNRDGRSTQEVAVFQLVLLSVEAGIARAAARDAADLVRARTRGFNTGNGAAPAEDPQILQRVGELSAQAAAARAIVLQAAREVDAAVGVLGQDPLIADPEALTNACELAVAQAHVVVPGLVKDVTDGIFDVLGASAVSRSKALDRHWRNARTIATHNPVVYKARIVGDHRVNGTPMFGLNAIGDVRRTAS
ncbi:acyl-CoA dehydrogenase [Kocuria varians]|uniref:Acyl-CoA dehydrogenase n=1 Tax=Kocuria varians TaxID=1272 RepID=A0A4Y4D0R0_KOCVA|nr:acyl-CoA dehydrogenase family protein [Kocuria varians]GEC98758.1 acyl-CoA dehydrogenase [Kocuria varians]